MSATTVLRYAAGGLHALEHCDPRPFRIAAADSWLSLDGRVLALDAHRTRFLRSAGAHTDDIDLEAFWDAAVDAVPRDGAFFPRVEVQVGEAGATAVLRLREAPARKRSAVLATWRGDDPRTEPTVKGPDLERLSRVRTSVQPSGADEAVLLTPDGYVVEGAYSALLWWRGSILCAPPADFARIDSVTAGAVVALARALGHDVHEEAVTPAELDGTEIWALSALHGIRIVTGWIDGPSPAELPGRLAAWTTRLDALRRDVGPRPAVAQ